MLDTIIYGATVVTPDGVRPSTVAIDGGRIVDLLAPGSEPEAACTIDATGKLVLPGMVAVVPNPPSMGDEALRALSSAAAFGGATSLAVVASAGGASGTAGGAAYQDMVILHTGVAAEGWLVVGGRRCPLISLSAAIGAAALHAAPASPLSPDRDPPVLALRAEEVVLALSQLYTQGVRRGRFGLGALAALVAGSPARALGIAPRKGVVAIGADADVVILDPDGQWTREACRAAGIAHRFAETAALVGRPILSLSRGRLLLLDDELKLRPGAGKVLHTA